MPEIIERKVFDPLGFPGHMNEHCQTIRLLSVYYGETDCGSHFEYPVVSGEIGPPGYREASTNVRRCQYERALHKWRIAVIGYWHYDRDTPELAIWDEYFDAYRNELVKAAEKYEELLARADRPERVRIVREVKIE